MDAVNQQQGAVLEAASPDASTQNSQVNSPPVENTGSSTSAAAPHQEGRIPYTRFQEVVSQKNEYAGKIENLERRLSAYESNLIQNRPSSQTEEAVSRLIAAGLEPNAAKLLIETQMSLLDSRVNDRIQPLEQRAQRSQVDEWIRGFAQDHADYRSLEPEMEKVFASLSHQKQSFIVGDPDGLEMLYWKVKGQAAQGQVQQSQVAGATQAYNNIAQKAAMATTPSASVGSGNELTREAIAKMPGPVYEQNRAAIFEAYKNGTIR